MLLTQSFALKFGECGSKTECGVASKGLFRVAEEFDIALASAVIASSRFSSSASSGVSARSLFCGLTDPELDSCCMLPDRVILPDELGCLCCCSSVGFTWLSATSSLLPIPTVLSDEFVPTESNYGRRLFYFDCIRRQLRIIRFMQLTLSVFDENLKCSQSRVLVLLMCSHIEG